MNLLFLLTLSLNEWTFSILSTCSIIIYVISFKLIFFLNQLYCSIIYIPNLFSFEVCIPSGSCHHNQGAEMVHHPSKIPMSLCGLFLPLSLATGNCWCAFGQNILVCIFYKWNHTLCILSCLVAFAQHNSFLYILFKCISNSFLFTPE